MPSILEKAKQLGIGAAEIAEWLGSGGEVVPQELAQERADICKFCHQNVKVGLMKAAVAEAAKRALDAKNKLELRVDGEKSLGECGTCGCVLRLLVWYPQKKIQPYLEENEMRRIPHHCWKLRKPE